MSGWRENGRPAKTIPKRIGQSVVKGLEDLNTAESQAMKALMLDTLLDTRKKPESDLP